MNYRILLCSVFVFFFACNNKATNKEIEAATLPPQYYYFPKANVYFDSANKTYVFLDSDGRSWQTATAIPAAMQNLLDKSILVQNPTEPVWQENEKHRLVYSALLYATPNDTTAKKEVPKINVPPPPLSDSSERANKKRKGIGKFFDKLFGRNKKDKRGREQEEEQ